MKTNDETALIQVAFGEPDAPAHVEQNLDRESAMKLDLYRQLKQDLRQARDLVPDDQLSPDRLRESILRAGLKRERRSLWTWALAPALGVLIALVAINRNPDVGETAPSFTERDASPVAVSQPAPEVEETLVAQATPANPIRSSVVPAKPTRRTASPTFRKTANTDSVGSETPAVPSVPVEFVEPAVMRATALDSQDVSPAPTVVMIETESDRATGLNIATEVKATANVVIGS